PVPGVVGGGDDAHALAVVPAAGGLDDDRPTGGVPEGGELIAGADRGPARARDAELAEGGAHDDLVLGVTQRVRAGTDGDALGLELPQQLAGHVLVLEGEHAGTGEDAA